MKIFKLNDTTEIVCERKKTRTAFKHEAVLIVNGVEKDKTKICYLNRTWERFEFEDVTRKLLGKFMEDNEINDFLNQIEKKENERYNSEFRAIAMVAKIGEVFGETKKEKNDWKARMLRAGLENKGLVMPEDWDSLSEDEKEKRLNGVIEQLK